MEARLAARERHNSKKKENSRDVFVCTVLNVKNVAFVVVEF